MADKTRITIIGLGSLGMSIGLALKASDTDLVITGHDREHAVAGAAKKNGAVDKTDWNLISACDMAEIVIVATPISEIESRYYLRMSTVDRPGVLAKISKVMSDNLISISSVIQKESDVSADVAEIVLMTYPAKEQAMQQAMGEIERLDVVREISNFVRVED